MPQPAGVCWGPQAAFIYNDAYRSILGERHPAALGKPLTVVWRELEDILAPALAEVMAGHPQRWDDVNLRLTQRGLPDPNSWFTATWTPLAALEGVTEGFLMVAEETTAQHRAERALQESESRQAFLLALSDAVSLLTDAAEIRDVACRLLGEHLNASRVYYIDYETEVGYGLVGHDYAAPGLPSLAGRYAQTDFEATFERLAHGVWVIDDVAADPSLSAEERDFYQTQGVLSWIDVPLLKTGRLKAILCVVQAETRTWTTPEITLVQEMAERLWPAIERAQAETALRESEARFQQFARASYGALWIRDASTLKLEYASPSIAEVFGVETQDVLSDIEAWSGLILPDEREGALGQIDRARRGEAVVHEFRIQRASDGAVRWIRNTEFPLNDGHGRVVRIGGVAEDITAAKQAEEYRSILLAELQHRVRNVLAMVRSVISRTLRGAEDIEEASALLHGRIGALSRTQTLLTRAVGVGVDLDGLVREELLAQGGDEIGAEISGPDVLLAPKTAEILTLAIHELATNATKYGAIAHNGKLSVTWAVHRRAAVPDILRLVWRESGVPVLALEARRRGFGIELIEQRIPYELKGSAQMLLNPGGAVVEISFPLIAGESILSTDQPGNFGRTNDDQDAAEA